MKRKILPYNPKLKDLAKQLRQNMTLAEILLWQQLKQKKLSGMDFDRQKPILNYIVDFYCKDLMLAIEVDGSSHEYKMEEDQVRQQYLESHGVRFLRFSDADVKGNLDGVVESIQSWIQEEIQSNGYIGRSHH